MQIHQTRGWISGVVGQVSVSGLLGMAALLLAPVALVGCGGGPEGPELFPVSGTVTFDGSPVDDGRILFRRAEGDQKAYSAEIKAGKYSLECEAGKVKVEITASRLIPGKFDTSNPDDEPQPVGEMYIPAKYNSESTLEAEVKSAGENTIPFDLTSK